MDEWKSEYARSQLKSYRAGLGYFHHVHPFVRGRAHCRSHILLDMETLVSVLPDGMQVCGRCRQLRLNYADPLSQGHSS